jgi:hypothetical protein
MLGGLVRAGLGAVQEYVALHVLTCLNELKAVLSTLSKGAPSD